MDENELLIETIQNLFQEQGEKLENINTSVGEKMNRLAETINRVDRFEKMIASYLIQQNAHIEKLIEAIGKSTKVVYTEIKNRPPDRIPEIQKQIREMEEHILKKEVVKIEQEHWTSVFRKHIKGFSVICTFCVLALLSFIWNICELTQKFLRIATEYWINC